MIKVAINGFGRIGRIAFRQMITSTDFDIDTVIEYIEKML